MSMDLDNEMLGLALTSQLDLINAMVKTSKELEHVARSSAETGSTKKQLAALSKKISSQTRRYKTVLELLELALQKDKERQEKLKEGLSYVE